jgi:hypothetical protein
MYGTAVNQLVTVAVFPDAGMVLQSIQLAGYHTGEKINAFPLFVRCSFPRIRNQGRPRPFWFGHIKKHF